MPRFPRSLLGDRRTRGALAGALVLIALATLVWIRSGPARIVAPAPEVVADVTPPDALGPSTLPVPVLIDLRTLVGEVERHVPVEWGTREEPIDVPERGRTNALVSLRRSAFRAEMRDSTARLSATVAYTVRATYDLPLLPDINMACGLGDDPPPRLNVTLTAPISLTRDWRLRTRSRVERVAAASSEQRDRCEVTFAGFDITGRVEGAARDYLADNTATIDSLVHEANVRASFERWWDVLRDPVALGDDIWLEIRPVGVRRGTVRGRGGQVEVLASLEATPRVVLGARPGRWPAELPPLEEGVQAGRLDVLVEARADYGAASDRLNEALAGFEVRTAGQLIRIEALEVSGIGGGRVALEAAVEGDLEGRLFLVGTPVYDPASGQVSVPDLDFSVETSSLLVRSASWTLDARLEAVLRERARWPVDFVVEWAGERLAEGLNRTLAPGVRLSGSVDGVRIVGVAAMSDGLVVRAGAQATASLHVNPG